MKNQFLTLLLLFGFGYLASAQSAYHIEHNPVDTVTTADTYDSSAHTEISNTTSTATTVHWVRTEVYLTSNITTAVCDPNLCYSGAVGEETFELQPGEFGQMTVHFYNSAFDPAPGQAGSGIVHLFLENVNDPSDTLTVVYTYSTLSGTKDLPLANVQLFPNPSTDYFSLKNADAVASLRLFSIDGREMARFAATAENNYSIANQPVGNYILALEDKNGNLFQAIELRKQ